MTEQQIRFNSGKPKLSYVFANATALQKFCDGNLDPNEPCAQLVLKHLANYLDGDEYALAEAAQVCLLALFDDANGTVTDPHALAACDGQTLLAHAESALVEVCAVYEYGEAKYARGNFRKGAPVTQYLDSGLRHVVARLRGDIRDSESGKFHLAHAFWNIWQALDQPEYRDDRLPQVAQESRPELIPVPELPEPDEAAVNALEKLDRESREFLRSI